MLARKYGAGTAQMRKSSFLALLPLVALTIQSAIYRDSEDGQFVKKEYAETHKSTTEKERVRVVPPGKAKK
jgi:hypothetical protein